MQRSNNDTFYCNGVFIKIHRLKSPILKNLTRSFWAMLGISEAVEYYFPEKKARFEFEVLELWRRHDLAAPEPLFLNGNIVCMSEIKGRTLGDFLSGGPTDWQPVVQRAFEEVYARHVLARSLNEPRLCHVDANPRNIILDVAGGVSRVDFEMGRPREPVEKWMNRELTKLLTSIVGGIGRDKATEIIRLFVSAYHDHAMLRQAIPVTPLVNATVRGSDGKSRNAEEQSEKYTVKCLYHDISRSLHD